MTKADRLAQDPSRVLEVGEPSEAGNEEQALELPTFTLLVRDIPTAEGGIAKVNPNQTLAEAKYLMASNDYSQLPVLSGTRNLKGVVSWRSIAKAELNNPYIGLMDAIDPYPKVVFPSQSLLEQIPTINEAGFVLVRGTSSPS
jgi:CBS-domain-containing membrane protein